MNFSTAITALIARDEQIIDEARTVVTRAVCDELDISYRSSEAADLGDWLAAGEYSGRETPASLAAEWRANA